MTARQPSVPNLISAIIDIRTQRGAQVVQRPDGGSRGFQATYVFSVAQICNLLYRRIAFCGASAVTMRSNFRTLCRLQIGDTADYKSALRGRASALNTYQATMPPNLSM